MLLHFDWILHLQIEKTVIHRSKQIIVQNTHY